MYTDSKKAQVLNTAGWGSIVLIGLFFVAYQLAFEAESDQTLMFIMGVLGMVAAAIECMTGVYRRKIRQNSTSSWIIAVLWFGLGLYFLIGAF